MAKAASRKVAKSDGKGKDAPKHVLRESSYDPTSRKHAGIGEKSDSEPLLEKHLQTNVAHADVLAARWNKRCETEGTVKWFNPLAPRDKRVYLEDKKKVEKDIRDNYKNTVKVKKAEGADPSTYTPQKFIESPKRTLADLVDPRHAAATQAAREVNAQLFSHNLGPTNRKGYSNALTAGTLLGLPEGTACTRVGDLNDEELKRAEHKATFSGKKRLLKEIRSELVRRLNA